MLLSDRDINDAIVRGRIGIDPFDPAMVQPSSVDVRLGDTLRVFSRLSYATRQLDLHEPIPDDLTHSVPADGFILRPGTFALGCTVEHLSLADDIAARLEGRSTLGRLGLAVHATAGYIDPGWAGEITLELSNVGPLDLVLAAGMSIGQFVFEPMSSRVARPYGSDGLGSKYRGQRGPTAARAAHTAVTTQ